MQRAFVGQKFLLQMRRQNVHSRQRGCNEFAQIIRHLGELRGAVRGAAREETG